MPFYRCFYHVVWATKHRAPLIDPACEAVLFPALMRKSRDLGCQLLGVNGDADHVHLAIVIPPSLAVADVIGQLKGASSRILNQTFPDSERFQWQEGYGVFSFGEKVLPDVLGYIARQKEHHHAGTTAAYLEQVGE